MGSRLCHTHTYTRFLTGVLLHLIVKGLHNTLSGFCYLLKRVGLYCVSGLIACYISIYHYVYRSTLREGNPCNAVQPNSPAVNLSFEKLRYIFVVLMLFQKCVD